MGGVWWLIKDVIVMPHGTDSRYAHNTAYALMGGVLMASIIHPANIGYGLVLGWCFG
jgi:hypothetical protein